MPVLIPAEDRISDRRPGMQWVEKALDSPPTVLRAVSLSNRGLNPQCQYSCMGVIENGGTASFPRLTNRVHRAYGDLFAGHPISKKY